MTARPSGVAVGPHDFRPLGCLDRFRRRGRCDGCYVPRVEHPTVRWVPARPYGDRRRRPK